jgi:hypothetical protein
MDTMTRTGAPIIERHRTAENCMKKTIISSIAALAIATGSAHSALAAPATTQPGAHVFVAVQITRAHIAIWDNAVEPRGFTVTFHVVNKDTKSHDFTLLGKTTHALAPGKSAQITIYLGRRGRYAYRSTVNPSTRLQGFFTVV